MAGYARTPLARKLGYRAGLSVRVLNAPADYLDLLSLDAATAVCWAAPSDQGLHLVHAFTSSLGELRQLLPRLRRDIRPDGAIWISWPKRASRVPTDVTEDRIRDAALPLGLVDIKVCAVDDTWSGLKLVIRKDLR